VLAGCTGYDDEDDVDETTQPITAGSPVRSNVAPYNSVIDWYGCSATKIGARRFLTAAHCFDERMDKEGTIITADVGGLGKANQDVKFTRIDIHPSWVSPGLEDVEKDDGAYDIAVFEIDTDTASIPTRPLRTGFVDVGTSFLVVGYGCDKAQANGGTGAKQQGTFTAASESDTNRNNHTILDLGSPVVCGGDSGGPAFIKLRSGTWQIAGVTATRGTTAPVSSFVRTGSVRRWINAPAVNHYADGEIGNLLNGKSAKCVGIDGGSPANGARASQFFCDGRNQPNDNQSWQLRSVGNGRFNFVNQKSGLCLGVDGASLQDFVELGQFNCAAPDPNNNQAWRVLLTSNDSGGNGYFQVVNGKSDKCMGVNGGLKDNGTHLIQGPCTALGSINNESWLFTR
jgi:V8-like Glu-specific endopeptidase